MTSLIQVTFLEELGFTKALFGIVVGIRAFVYRALGSKAFTNIVLTKSCLVLGKFVFKLLWNLISI